VYSISYNCGRCYIGETSRSLEVQPDPRSARKIKISTTCIRRRPQDTLETSEGPAYWTEHQLQKIQGIRPHVSGSLFDQSAQLGHLYHLDFHHWSGNQTITTPPNLEYMRNLLFYVGTTLKNWFYFLLEPIWYLDIFVCLNFNPLYLYNISRCTYSYLSLFSDFNLYIHYPTRLHGVVLN
jgi:hypothetical protein